MEEILDHLTFPYQPCNSFRILTLTMSTGWPDFLNHQQYIPSAVSSTSNPTLSVSGKSISLKNTWNRYIPPKDFSNRKKKTPCDFSGSIGLEVPRWMGRFFNWKNRVTGCCLTGSGEQPPMLAGIESWENHLQNGHASKTC